jgi:hypothetical protein
VRQGARDNLDNLKFTKALESLGLKVDDGKNDKSMKRPADDAHDKERPTKMKASTEPPAAPVAPKSTKSVAKSVPKGDIRSFFT